MTRPDNDTKFVQDTTHIATKLRNRLLKSKTMRMGRSVASIEHLKTLLVKVQKSVHGLTQYDVCPLDKQNFDSFTKLTNVRVIESLQQFVPNSEATVHYLKMCFDITSSYLDYEISPLERVFRIFRSIYFLRIWRNHVLCTPQLRLQDNFISANAYTCIELNGKCMLELLKMFRQNGSPRFFCLLSSIAKRARKYFDNCDQWGLSISQKLTFPCTKSSI